MNQIVRCFYHRPVKFNRINYINLVNRNFGFCKKFSSSSGKEVEKYPEGKPSWEKLQHICIRLADTVMKIIIYFSFHLYLFFSGRNSFLCEWILRFFDTTLFSRIEFMEEM